MWSRRNSKTLVEPSMTPKPVTTAMESEQPHIFIGRQIVPTVDVLGELSPRSPPLRRVEFPPTSSRRGSLPAMHLRSLSASSAVSNTTFQNAGVPVHQPIPGSDDLYSGLSTFTFGSPRNQPSPSPSYEADEESDVEEQLRGQSPLSHSNRRLSYDKTPRPSVSGPSRQPHTQPRATISGVATAKRGSLSSSLKSKVPGARVNTSGYSSSDSAEHPPPAPHKSLSGSISSTRLRAQPNSTLAGKQRQPVPTPIASTSPSSGVTSSPSSGETSSDRHSRTAFDLEAHIIHTKQAASVREHDFDAASNHTFGGGPLGSSSSSRTSNSRAESVYSAYSRRTDGDSLYDQSLYGGPSDSRRVSISSSRYGMEFSSDEGEAVYDAYHRPSPRVDGEDEYWPVDVRAGFRASVPPVALAPVDVMSLHPSAEHRENFYRTLGDSSTSGQPPASSTRRPSLPMSIPGTTPPGRDREGSHATVRRPSRSLDNDPTIPVFSDEYNLGGLSSLPGAQPRSDPVTGGDWLTRPDWNWQQKHPAVLGADAIDPLQRLPDHELARIKDAEEQAAEATDDVYQGLNLNYILSAEGDITNDGRRSSDALSYVQRHRSSSAGIWGWNNNRRPSTATGEDTFDRLVTRWDKDYGVRKGEWSFKREKADGFASNPTSPSTAFSGYGAASSAGSIFSNTHSPLSTVVASANPRPNMQSNADKEKTRVEKMSKARAGMVPGTQEIWRCDFVGRFKVDRTALARQDPSRSPQQRVEMKHIPDPYSKGNTRGGPSSVVHKHSRAIAFSIFRGHRLTNHQRPTVLLAPKRVQEEYTSTKTTSKLSTHGLLEDSGRRRAASVGQPEKRRPDKERDSKREKEKKQRDKDREKELRRALLGPGSSVSSKAKESDTGSSSHGDGKRFDPRSHPPPSSAPSAVRRQPSSTFPKQPSDALRKHASTRNMRSDVASLSGSTKNSSESERSTVVRPSHGRDRDFDDDESPARTPHSEAFATLDSSTLEYQRGKHVHQDSGSGLFSSVRRIFNNPTKGSVKSGHYAAGATAASLEGQYTPPWLTMAPRSRQEEQERVIQNLNESFKDVGLLPSFKTASRPKEPKRPVSKTGINIFENVPEDSLYMLLPLWPGETDPSSTADEEHVQNNTLSADERLYLLVYYVPFPKKPLVPGEPIKKKPEPRSLDASLGAFYVVARLVGYEELRGTGVRLPSEGLSINGPSLLAMENVPSPSMRFEHGDQVICMCEGRQIGMEFVPEGLVKLGLCMPIPEPEPDADPEDEPEVLLSEVGRAAVEMAWLGCMALLSFGPAG